MFGSQILDTAIGLVFVLLLVSILVTIANEIVASVLRSRAKWLRIGIEQLIGSQWAADLYAHPLIQGSSIGGKGPSYIPSRAYASVLLDLVHRADPSVRIARDALRDALARVPSGTGTIDDIKVAVQNATANIDSKAKAINAIGADFEALVNEMPTMKDGLADYTVGDAKRDIEAFIDGIPGRYMRHVLAGLPNSGLKDTLTVLLDDADHDIGKFKENIEVWFNNAMDRVGGWYKRKSQYIIGAIALVVTVGLNVDALLILQQLNTQSGLRDSLVAQAKTFAERPPVMLQGRESATIPAATTDTSADADVGAGTVPATGANTSGSAETDERLQQNFRTIQGQLSQLSLPIGWFFSDEPDVKAAAPVSPAASPASSPTAPANGTTRPVATDKTKNVGATDVAQVRADASVQFQKDHFLFVPWTKDGAGWWKTIRFHLTGWLLTALAASLGAPFWFDVLNKFIAIRSAGKAPEERPKSPKDVPTPLEPGQSPREADRAEAIKSR